MVRKEVPFVQKFDIIVEKKRRILDIERDRYPKCQKEATYYLNGSTGEFSTDLNKVIRTDRKYVIYSIEAAKKSKKGYSIEYSKENNSVIFHLIVQKPVDCIRQGGMIKWEEFSRFIIEKKELFVLCKGKGWRCRDNSRTIYCDPYSLMGIFKEDEQYDIVGYGKKGLPVTGAMFDDNIDRYVNPEDGSKNGFLKVISNIIPAVFNVSGNNYIPITDYNSMYQYFCKMEIGFTCAKKTGKSQEIIDSLLKHKLPEIERPTGDFNNNCDDNEIYKFAVIQKVPDIENTCVIRTVNYIPEEDVIFEGGRIYVDKTINFCKKNNAGEYVAQALLSKVNHWDFSLNKFPEDETKGTLLEYFGTIVQEISEENRAIAIWMFLKEPFLESLAKISSIDFIDSFIDGIRETNDLDTMFHYAFGILNRSGKKIFQVLGLNKNQFEIIKDYIELGMPKTYACCDRYSLSLGIIPALKKLATGSEHTDISYLDINTFKIYYDFMMDLFELYDIYNSKLLVKEISYSINKVLELICRQREIFPLFDIKSSFEILKWLTYENVKYLASCRNTWRDSLRFFSQYEDYLRMVDKLEEKDNFKPKFSSYDDLVTMHDNVAILASSVVDNWKIRKFKELHENVWSKFEFKQDEKKNKDGDIVQEGLPFVVVAPKTPFDLAREGTILHHCVKSYIDRVAEGQTNIMFIRKKDEHEIPFFTVEITNEKVIEQVHGFGNRNADTEPGLLEFVDIYRQKLKFKKNNINKVR